MKKEIHPKIYTDCIVKCACGNSFTTISTLPSMNVDTCSACHPLFTGQQRFVDTEGRIEKFNKKAKQMEEKVSKHKALKEARKKGKTSSTASPKPTLKEIFKQMKEESTPQPDNSETAVQTKE